jgi:hypothetical protein
VLIIPVVVVFFTFPPLLPVNGENMSKCCPLHSFVTSCILTATLIDYTVVVMGIVAVLGLLNWVFHAVSKLMGKNLPMSETVANPFAITLFRESIIRDLGWSGNYDCP